MVSEILKFVLDQMASLSVFQWVVSLLTGSVVGGIIVYAVNRTSKQVREAQSELIGLKDQQINAYKERIKDSENTQKELQAEILELQRRGSEGTQSEKAERIRLVYRALSVAVFDSLTMRRLSMVEQVLFYYSDSVPDNSPDKSGALVRLRVRLNKVSEKLFRADPSNMLSELSMDPPGLSTLSAGEKFPYAEIGNELIEIYNEIRGRLDKKKSG